MAMVVGKCVPILSQVNENQRMPFIICFVILSICATIFNLVVLYLFIKYKTLRIASNKFIISLAVGDLLLGILLAPLNVAQLLLNKQDQNCIVNTLAKFLTTLMAISGVTLGCIAYDRYLNVLSLTMYTRKMNKRMVAILIILPWFSPIILVASKFAGLLINSIVVICLAFIAYATLLFSYIKLMKLLKTKVYGDDLETHIIKKIKEKNKNMVNFLGWVLFWAFICTVPIVINRFLKIHYMLSDETFKFYELNQPFLTAFAHAAFILNSCINPLLYCYKHQGFHKAFIKTFKRRSTTQRRVRFHVSKVVPMYVDRHIMEPS